jgi:ABC-type lipoprotein release transport system permease subunit
MRPRYTEVTMNIWGIWELKKIAMRNLARHKVKTILTSAAVMVSVALYIFLNSWLGGMKIESRRNIVNYEMGAAKLQTVLYFERKEEMPSYENFKDWEIYREALKEQGYSSAPRYVFSGTLFSASGSAPIMFHGIDPELERHTMRYIDRWEGNINRWDEQYVDFGRWVQNGEFEINIGTLAAERLRVGIPLRPLRKELEELITQVTNNQADEDFIKTLYEERTVYGLFFV